MSGLCGKAFIVTGSSSGIGQETAILLASKGCSVALCGRDEARLEGALKACRETALASGYSSSKFVSVLGDLTETGVRARLVDRTLEVLGKIDCVVWNHGVALANDSLETLTEEVFDTIISTNLKSGLFLVQACVPHLKKTQGCVVCVASIASRVCTSQALFTYSAGKAALEHMVKSMALDLGPKGIRVNCINPTFIRTRIFRKMFPDPAHLDGFQKLFSQATPLSGVPSTTQHPAQAIAYLASKEADMITGASIVIDGGVICKGNPPNYSK